MKKLFLFFVLLLFLMVFLVNGEKLGVLTDILRPQSLEVEGGRLYVIDMASVYIYSVKDLKLIRKFGQRGDGPGELRGGSNVSYSISVYPGYLLVADEIGDGIPGIRKILYFTHEGKFIKERRNWPQMIRVHPIGKNYVVNKIGRDDNGQEFSFIAIYDADLKLKKELSRQEVSANPKRFFMVPDTIQFTVYNEKIYLENSKEGFEVEVFDSEGNLVSDIKKNVKPIKFTNSHKKIIMEEFEEDPLIKYNASHMGGIKQYLKHFKMVWPDFLPWVRNIIVSGNNIYLQTFNQKDNKVEYVIMDFKGNNQKSVFLPKVILAPLAGRVLGSSIRFFDIENDKFYYIVENVEEENWEVHVEKI